MKTVALSAIVALSVSAADAAVVGFTDRASFDAAVAALSTTTLDFNSQTTPGAFSGNGNAIGGGLTLDVSPDAASVFFVGGGLEDFGFPGNGTLELEPEAGDMIDGRPGSARINFPNPIFGFGFDIESEFDRPSVSASEIGFAIDGVNYLLSDILGLTTDAINSTTEIQNAPIPSGSFAGLLSDTPFTSVRLLHGDDVVPGGVSGGTESILVDNFTIASAAPVAPVPLPAGLPLLLTAIAGFAVFRRRGARVGAR